MTYMPPASPVNLDASITSLSAGSLTTVARADHVHTVSNIVTSIVAGTGITVSGATGAVTVTSPTAMVLLGSTTLSSAAATISVSGIPSNYTDLIWVLSNARVSGAVTETLFCRLNGDTGSNYTVGTSTIQNYISSFNTSSSTANSPYTWASQRIVSYSDTSSYKMSIYTTYAYQGSANISGATISPGLWRSTSVVTSVSLTAALTSLASGTKLSVYGVL